MLKPTKEFYIAVGEGNKMDDLKTNWTELASRYTNDEKLIADLWFEIEKCHTNKTRHYHNLTHLKYMVDRAIKYEDHLDDPDTVMFSIFYHDIVYDSKRSDNEQKSADIASNRLMKLDVPTEKIAKCQNQILATKNHEDGGDNDTNYLLDFDLAILSDSAENYRDYAKKIREEYSIYPNFLYRNGRKKVLQHFLAMDRIFKTDEYQKNFEKQARENLRSELEEL